MEIIPHPTLPSRIIMGYRNPGAGKLGDPNGAQRVLTGIVKGTFHAGGAGVSPAGVQLPVFEQDIFFNLVRNSDFTTGAQTNKAGEVITPVAGWQREAPAAIAALPANAPQRMQVTGSGRVVQPITFDRPLGGRTFALSLRMMGGAAVTLSGIRLEAPSGAAIFAGDRSLTTNFAVFNSVATWPAGVTDDKALLVLTGAASTTVDYDWARLNEGSLQLTPDAHDPIRYEHDLAIYKPRADVVILGLPAPPQANPKDNQWREIVAIGAESMTASFENGALTHLNGALLPPGAVPWSNTTPITIGWQNRLVNGGSSATRQNHAGINLGAFNPDTMELPQDFNNLFFNGALYSGDQPVFAHITANLINVTTSADYDDGSGGVETITRTTPLHLPAPPQMTVAYRANATPDAPVTTVNVPMNLDTVVYEKAANRFYAVWRGVWADFEAVGLARMVRLALA